MTWELQFVVGGWRVKSSEKKKKKKRSRESLNYFEIKII